MSKQYTVAQPFWRQGILLPEGEKVRMTDEEAKNLRHLLDEVDETAQPDAEPTAQSTAESEHVREPKEAPAPRDGADPEAVAINTRIASAIKARKA